MVLSDREMRGLGFSIPIPSAVTSVLKDLGTQALKGAATKATEGAVGLVNKAIGGKKPAPAPAPTRTVEEQVRRVAGMSLGTKLAIGGGIAAALGAGYWFFLRKR